MRRAEAVIARSYAKIKLAQAGCATPLTTEQPAFTSGPVGTLASARHDRLAAPVADF
jgi:hypothetical protein